ncbi:thioredoxin-like protein [Daedalea quercina L-15889]|uniref:glutathione transferase n=1 Tax=Daedalea quercina L-15889 TaxID=1314783 RepID=A0A165R392_9APHY|nr:thioredoxin-like protein [Daedalea quercina L-15889]
MSHGKQFTLFTHVKGPNGWKVAYILAELGLDFEPKYLDFDEQEQKGPEHMQYNPNGRIPTLIDHANNNFAIWESNAIILYLVEKYDTDHRISVSDASEQFHQLQWLFFQASGQGPYYGQASWFTVYHPEKLPSAIERYKKEIIRVLRVLESVLSKQEWLVGGKCTIADISFVPWNTGVLNRLKEGNSDVSPERDLPGFWIWEQDMLQTRMGSRQ